MGAQYAQYPPPQPVYYEGPQYSGCLKFFLYAISFLIPLAGLIIGLIYLSRRDRESERLGTACLVLAGVGFVTLCCLGIVIGFGSSFLLSESYYY